MENTYIGKDGQVYCDITRSGKHYVYAHLNPKTGEFYYIGSGHSNRCNQIVQRNEYWKKYFNEHGMLVKLIDYYLTKEQAIEIEKELIQAINPICNIMLGGESGYDKGLKKRVYAYNKDGSFFMEFRTVSDANVFFNINANDSRILRCVKGERKSYKGKIWSETKLSAVPEYKVQPAWNIREVHRYDLNGNYIESYNKLTDFKGGWHTGICNVLDTDYTCKNSFWRTYKVDKIEASKKAEALKESVRVIDITTNVIYDSISKAARANGIKPSNLQRKLQGKRNNNTNLRYYGKS
jgi:hypothetical protein